MVMREDFLEEVFMSNEDLNNLVSNAVEAIKCFVLEGPDRAMTRFNRNAPPQKQESDQSKSSEEKSPSNSE